MTIKLLFVCDGPRDAPCVPRIVERILETPVTEDCRIWARLNDKEQRPAKGLARKIQFAIRQAKDSGAAGLIATVDRDKEARHSRLKDMQEGRNLDRTANAIFPTALGEADPHFEAWLLDDPVAVRTVLGLASNHPIPVVTKVVSPKVEIDKLIDLRASRNESGYPAPQTRLLTLADIARQVDLGRCQHDKEIGLKAFADDVKRELRPLLLGKCP